MKELSVAEQRYKAVLAVIGEGKTPGSPKVTPAELLVEAVPLAAELLRTVIDRGGVSDWEALVLGEDGL